MTALPGRRLRGSGDSFKGRRNRWRGAKSVAMGKIGDEGRRRFQREAEPVTSGKQKKPRSAKRRKRGLHKGLSDDTGAFNPLHQVFLAEEINDNQREDDHQPGRISDGRVIETLPCIVGL